MSQSQTQKTNLFRMSLRDWQANFKAQQQQQEASQNAQESDSSATQPQPAVAAQPILTPSGQPRVKRLVAHKKRRLRRAAEMAGR